MTVIVCVDDRGGMMFNKRRLSRDRAVYADIASDFDGKRLLMSELSAPLFAQSDADITVSDSFLDEADGGCICFVEDRKIAEYANKTDTLVIYKWNRHYPSDMKLDIDPLNSGFRLLSVTDLAGHSHDKITKEIYVK